MKSVHRSFRVAVRLVLTTGLLAAARDGLRAQTPSPKKVSGTIALKPAGASAEKAVAPKTRTSRKKKDKSKKSEGVSDFASSHFLLHTDLADDEAEELLDRLETMLPLIAKYWGRPLSGGIEMYVVKDLKNWPPGALPDEGRPAIERGAGVTISQGRSNGQAFVAKSTVFAVADRGTPQHEAVHAYCAQTFGRSGPIWYSEGMAEKLKEKGPPLDPPKAEDEKKKPVDANKGQRKPAKGA